MSVIWICGHRKCGTTLLSNLLDGHGDIINYGTDFKLIYAFYNGFDSEKGKSYNLERFKMVFEDDRYGEVIDWDFVEPIVKDLDFTTRECVWQYLNKLRKLVAENYPGKKLLIKETSSELYRNSISTHVAPKYLYCVRDPRDNWAAIRAGIEGYYSKMGEDSLKAIASLINRVNLGFGAFKRSIEHTDRKENWLDVKFENVTQFTERTMSRMSDFLGIEFSDALLSPTKENLHYAGNSHDGKKFSGVSSSNVGRFTERTSRWEIAVIEGLCHEMMQYFEYETITSPSEQEAAVEEYYAFYNQTYFYYDKFSHGLKGY